MRQRVVSFILVFLLSQARAHAQDARGPTFPLRVFRPAIDSKGLVTVNASQTLGHLDFSLGLIADYAHRSLGLYAHGVELSVDHLVTVQLQAAFGLFGGPRWQARTRGVSLELGVSLPVHVMLGRRSPPFTDVDPNLNRQLTFSGQSVGDLGLHAKLRLLDTSHHPLGLALLVSVTAPTGRSDRFLGEGQLTVRPELIIDRELGRSRRGRLALNVGALVRPARHRFVDEGTTLELPSGPRCAPARTDEPGCGTGLARELGTQLTWSLGASYAIVPHRFDLVAEVFGAHDLTGARGGHPVEALVAAKVYLARSSFFTVGAGAGLSPPRIVDGEGGMTGQPLARVFVGFTFEPVIGDRRRP
jgi:OmpA-OmpF porin, OOP family